jgi:hypothetical protein
VGQLSVHLLLPEQSSVEPEPSVMLASAPPETVTLLSGPVSSTQPLWPVQLELQPAWQVPTHVEPAAQLVVQPVPQFTLHVVFALHVYVTLLATTGPPSALPPPPPVVPPPKVHDAPVAHVHAAPTQTHPPSVVDVQFAKPFASGPLPASVGPPSPGPESVFDGGGGAVVVVVAVGVVAVAVAVGVGFAASGVSGIVAALSSPQPTATPTPTRPRDVSRTTMRSFDISAPPPDGSLEESICVYKPVACSIGGHSAVRSRSRRPSDFAT